MKEMYILAGIGALLVFIGAALLDLTTMDILAGSLLAVGIFVIFVAPIAMD